MPGDERPTRSADWQSAVSQIANLQAPADCQSAVQQIANLRYRRARLRHYSSSSTSTSESRGSEPAPALSARAVLDLAGLRPPDVEHVGISRDPRGNRIDANRFGADLLRRRAGQNVSLTSPDGDRPRNFTVQRAGRALGPDELPIQKAARGEACRRCRPLNPATGRGRCRRG